MKLSTIETHVIEAKDKGAKTNGLAITKCVKTTLSLK